MKKYSKIQYFFWLLSGAEISILKDCPTDYNKQAGIGFTVFMTTLLAFCSGGYAGYYFSDSIFAAIIFGIIWSMLVFSIDRSMIITLKKNPTKKQHFWLPLLFRFILSLLIAFIISIPLELLIFSENIELGMDKYKEERALELRKSSELAQDTERKDKNISRTKEEISNIENELKAAPSDGKYKAIEREINLLENHLKELNEMAGKARREANIAYSRVPEDPYSSEKDESSSQWKFYLSKLGEKRRAERNLNAFDHKKLKELKDEKVVIYNKWYNEKNEEKERLQQLNKEAAEDLALSEKITEDKTKNLQEKMEDKKGFVLRYMILEDLAKLNSNKEDADSRRAIFLLLWLIRAIFILVEFLPSLVKVITPIGAYDRALFQREKDMEKDLQESSEKYLQQQAIFREMDYKAQEEQKKKQTEIEQQLQSETLEEIMKVQKDIIHKKIEKYKSQNLS